MVECISSNSFKPTSKRSHLFLPKYFPSYSPIHLATILLSPIFVALVFDAAGFMAYPACRIDQGFCERFDVV